MLRRCWLALIAVSFLSPAALARESIAPESSPQTTWREVLTQFRQSARLAQNGKLAEAQSLLEKLSESVRAPYAQHTKVLLSALPRAFADHSEALRYRMYQERASAAERLGEYEVAMIWTRRASELLEPSARGNDLEHIVWLLAATRTEGDAPGSIKAQLEFIQGHFLEGAPNANKPDRLFAGLERLTPLLEQTNDAAERRQIHGQIQACLLALGDADGLTAWEDQMLGEVWVSLEDRAGVAIQRGDRAYKGGRKGRKGVRNR